MLKSAVLSFSVLSYSNEINVLIWGINAFNRFARPYVSKQMKLFSQSHVQRSKAFADWSLKWSFEAVSILPDCVHALGSNEIALFGLPLCVNLMVLKLYGNLQGLKDILDTLGYLWANSIAREENHFVFTSRKQGLFCYSKMLEHIS